KVKKDGLLSTNAEVAEIIQLAANDMKATLGVKTSGTKGDAYLIEVFGEGLEAYEKKHPKSKQDDYLNLFKNKVTTRVIEKVCDKLLAKVINRAKSKYKLDLSQLNSTLSTSCMQDLYTNLTKPGATSNP